MADPDLGDDVERPAARKRDVELGERLQAAAEAADVGRRIPLAMALSLPMLGGDQRQDAVRLAQVEPGEDDGIGDVAARRGHGRR